MHVHAMHADGRFGTSVARLGVSSVRVKSAFHLSAVGTWAGGNLRPARGELLDLTKGLKLGSYRSRLADYYGRTLVGVVTAVLKAVSLPKGTNSG